MVAEGLDELGVAGADGVADPVGVAAPCAPEEGVVGLAVNLIAQVWD